MKNRFDLAVIGSGGAAFAAAIHARRLDAQVVMVERATIGGTCVNVGCVPSKTLLAAAKTYQTARSHPFAGVATGIGPVDLEALMAQKDDLVAGMRQHKYLDLADRYGFDIVSGQASFTGPTSIEVDGRSIDAAAYVIAAGAEPAVPDIPGLGEAGFLTSTTAMELTQLPESVIVIGGGFVGLEQSQLFARLGAQVTVIGRLAPRSEPELASRLRDIFADEGINVINARATAVETHGATRTVRTDRGGAVTAQAILIATGRSPRVDGLDLAAAEVKLDDRGFVDVDANLRTSNPTIFAAGDVTGGPQYVYVAAAQGHTAAANALGAGTATVDYRGLPSVIFTDPQLASAGHTEADALAAGHTCDCRILGLEDVPRGLVEHDTRGAIKLVAERDTGKILGVHALAAGAGDTILAATYAIKYGLTVTDVAETWAPYLTMSEALRLAAQSFTTPVDQLSCCAI